MASNCPHSHFFDEMLQSWAFDQWAKSHGINTLDVRTVERMRTAFIAGAFNALKGEKDECWVEE